MMDGSVLLEQAKAEPQREVRPRRGVKSRYNDMLPAVKELRARGFTWNEISQWFEEKDVKVSKNSLSTAYSRSLKPRKRKAAA